MTAGFVSTRGLELSLRIPLRELVCARAARVRRWHQLSLSLRTSCGAVMKASSRGEAGPTRCRWAEATDSLGQAYHDTEWGIPVHDDTRLFEMLSLEGAQAGLSWATILKKREGYRAAFAQFDIEKVAAFTDEVVEELVLDPAIVRHRMKIMSVVHNARVCLQIREDVGSLDNYIWSFTKGKTIYRNPDQEMPVTTELSDTISKDMKKRGFKFVGSTTIYAFLQAVGVVNDHDKECFLFRVGQQDTEKTSRSSSPKQPLKRKKKASKDKIDSESVTEIEFEGRVEKESGPSTTVTWYYTRAGCSTCKKAEAFLATRNIIPETVQKAGSGKLGRSEARSLLAEADRVVACKGKKTEVIGLASEPSEAEVTSILGPTGNLRAPIVKLENGVVIVGFNEGVFSTEL